MKTSHFILFVLTINLVAGCAMFNKGKRSKLDLLTEIPGEDAVIVKEGDYKFYFDRNSWLDQLKQLTASEYSDEHRKGYMRTLDSIQEMYTYIDPLVLDEISRMLPAGIQGSRPIIPNWATEELFKFHIGLGMVFVEDANRNAVKTLIRTKPKHRFGYYVVFTDKMTNKPVFSYSVKTKGNF